MEVTGIQAALERVVQKLSADQRVSRETKASFLDLLEQVVEALHLGLLTYGGGDLLLEVRIGVDDVPLGVSH